MLATNLQEVERKIMEACKKAGIKYFEHSHLFTQWGAKHAPKVIATVNGEKKRIFGWDVLAVSDEYKEFLAAFMPAIRPCAAASS